MSGDIDDKFWTTPEAIDALLRKHMAYVDAQLARPSDNLQPVLRYQFIRYEGNDRDIPPDHGIAFIMGHFNGWQVKSAAMRMAGRTLYQAMLLPQAVCLCAEGWTAISPEGLPHADPNRKEVISCSALGHVQGGKPHKMMALMPVSRHRINNCIIPGAWKVQVFGPDDIAEMNLLMEFFKGFYEGAAKRMGHTI